MEQIEETKRVGTETRRSRIQENPEIWRPETEIGSMPKRSHNKRMQGTPQAYLSSVAGVGFAASPNVNGWLKGRP